HGLEQARFAEEDIAEKGKALAEIEVADEQQDPPAGGDSANASAQPGVGGFDVLWPQVPALRVADDNESGMVLAKRHHGQRQDGVEPLEQGDAEPAGKAAQAGS